jgi:hypothetical protein
MVGCMAQAQSTADCQIEATLLDYDVLACVCRLNGRSEPLPTDATIPGELYYDVEENIYIQINRTVICKAK